MALSVGLVAGEASGDLLGAGLIRAIRERYPDARFQGVAGPAMVEAGCRAWFPSERLAVMGLVEVLGHLRDLLALRRDLVARFAADPPDVVVGIDSPDFNLPLEGRLKALGIRTVHYVSPSVWAWRPGRARRMRQTTDLVLCLLPFEKQFYDECGVSSRFVGHPMADDLPMEPDRAAARDALGLGTSGEWLAVLPGSRRGEVQALAADFAGAVAWLHQRRPDLGFVGAMATGEVAAVFRKALDERAPGAPVTLVEGRSRTVMAASDAVLVASGTATLEAALIKRPMVVAYRLAPVTRWILETFKLLNVDRFALPNLLSGEGLVPEILQDAVTPEALGAAVLSELDDPDRRARLEGAFRAMHETLRRDASRRAADSVLDLVGRLPPGGWR